MKLLLAVGVLSSFWGIPTIEYNAIEYVQEEKKEEILLETSWTEERIIEEIKNTFPENAEVMIKVAQCESGIKNVPGKLSDDGGIFQINQVHLPRLQSLEMDRYDIKDNIKFARMLYDESGLNPWKNSKHCWS